MRQVTIKQLLPIPDRYTPLTKHEKYGTKKYWYVDAIAEGETVLYALIEDEDMEIVHYYTSDCLGVGDIELDDIGCVMLVPTVYCPNCRSRMIAHTTPEDPERVVYNCICGESIAQERILDLADPKSDTQ